MMHALLEHCPVARGTRGKVKHAPKEIKALWQLEIANLRPDGCRGRSRQLGASTRDPD